MKFSVQDEEAMIATGERLAKACRGPLVVYLYGPLGAGKTTLVRGFMRGMGYDAAVKSPTYTLIEPYEVGPWQVYHLDLYRVADAAELEYLGLRELQDHHAIVLVEWPERGKGFLPAADMVITLDYADPGRRISLEARSVAGRSFMEACEGIDLNPG